MKKIAVVESEQEAKLLTALNQVCGENKRMRAALEEVLNGEWTTMTQLREIAKSALEQ